MVGLVDHCVSRLATFVAGVEVAFGLAESANLGVGLPAHGPNQAAAKATQILNEQLAAFYNPPWFYTENKDRGL